MTTFLRSSQLVTYRYFSSGENASPLGRLRSVLTSFSAPSMRQNTPLNGSSFAGSSYVVDNPNGGSVKNRAPSERYTRSLRLFSRLPLNRSARTVSTPFFSSRV